ncbi:MAG TPA: hypothetical protein VD926_10425 [Acidimicrobiales bacterium]|nr:hypothetical protein [Acidimicrobiales bacterium]
MSDQEPKDDLPGHPDAGTVDDWFGQNVAEDQEVADQAVEDAGGDMDKAEELFEERAEGEEKYEEGHPRPD